MPALLSSLFFFTQFFLTKKKYICWHRTFSVFQHCSAHFFFHWLLLESLDPIQSFPHPCCVYLKRDVEGIFWNFIAVNFWKHPPETLCPLKGLPPRLFSSHSSPKWTNCRYLVASLLQPIRHFIWLNRSLNQFDFNLVAFKSQITNSNSMMMTPLNLNLKEESSSPARSNHIQFNCYLIYHSESLP